MVGNEEESHHGAYRDISGRPPRYVGGTGYPYSPWRYDMHAAVVARGMGKCCVSGAGEIKVDYKEKTVIMDGKTYKEGDWISLNGSTGDVYDGQVPTVDAELSGDFAAIMNLLRNTPRLMSAQMPTLHAMLS